MRPCLQPVTLSHLRLVVFSMRSSSACGTDGLCIRIFKLSFDTIGPILLHINSRITLNEVPAVWKHALVHPIQKSGNPDDPSDFRPISILPVMAKVVEKVAQHQLYDYPASNHLLSPSQHGFRPQHCTETAFINVTDRALSAMDQGELRFFVSGGGGHFTPAAKSSRSPYRPMQLTSFAENFTSLVQM